MEPNVFAPGAHGQHNHHGASAKRRKKKDSGGGGRGGGGNIIVAVSLIYSHNTIPGMPVVPQSVSLQATPGCV